MTLPPGHRPHAACSGRGQIIRDDPEWTVLALGGADITCKGCAGSGEAMTAFMKLQKRIGLEPSDTCPTFLDTDQDHTIDSFAAACHGDDSTRAGQVVAILQHCVDRAAFDTVWRLGSLDSVFSWLCSQEAEHCSEPEGEEDFAGT